MSGERISLEGRNAMAAALGAVLDSGGAAGTIDLWNGALPALTSDAPGGASMATIGLAYPCGSASGGALLLSATTADPSVEAPGMPTFGRIRKSTGVVVMILPAMLAADYDILSDAEKGALGNVIRINYSLSAGVPINFSGTLAIVMPGG